MEGFAQTPPDGLWEAVEAELPREQVVFPSWVWGFAGVAAALFVVMLIWPKGNKKAGIDGDALAVVTQEAEIQPVTDRDSVGLDDFQLLPSASEAAISSDRAPVSRPSGISASSGKVALADNLQAGEVTAGDNSLEDAASKVEDFSAGEVDASGEKDSSISENTTPAEQSSVGEIAESAAGDGNHAVLVPLERTKSAFRPNLTAAVLAGGIPGKAFDSYTSYGMANGVREGALSLKKAPVALLSRNKATRNEVNHSVALRVGAMVQLSLNEHWGVESGLQLSSLDTRTKSVTGNMTAATDKLTSYLGVPLLAVYTPFRVSRFALYASAGPMLEYGFRSVTAEESYIGSERVSSDKNTAREQEFIWSAGANIGAQWNLGDLGALFIQPGVSYHFAGESNQDSFYTAHPFCFAMSAGFRFTF